MRSPHFFTADASVIANVPDVGWFDESGEEMLPENWEFPEGRLLALRRVAAVPEGPADVAAVSLLMLNAPPEDRDFDLPQPVMQWRVLLDSSLPPEREDGKRPVASPVDNKITIAAHSAVLLVAQHETK
ncbi:MAG: hypothetical protein NVSMB6_28950 [Burkholderiaceae bacterium]